MSETRSRASRRRSRRRRLGFLFHLPLFWRRPPSSRRQGVGGIHGPRAGVFGHGEPEGAEGVESLARMAPAHTYIDAQASAMGPWAPWPREWWRPGTPRWRCTPSWWCRPTRGRQTSWPSADATFSGSGRVAGIEPLPPLPGRRKQTLQGRSLRGLGLARRPDGGVLGGRMACDGEDGRHRRHLDLHVSTRVREGVQEGDGGHVNVGRCGVPDAAQWAVDRHCDPAEALGRGALPRPMGRPEIGAGVRVSLAPRGVAECIAAAVDCVGCLGECVLGRSRPPGSAPSSQVAVCASSAVRTSSGRPPAASARRLGTEGLTWRRLPREAAPRPSVGLDRWWPPEPEHQSVLAMTLRRTHRASVPWVLIAPQPDVLRQAPQGVMPAISDACHFGRQRGAWHINVGHVELLDLTSL